jgi:hypothetical protein
VLKNAITAPPAYKATDDKPVEETKK